ncbi:MAG TPA: DNA polymerase III subunit delta [Methylomirabilota bacterium]
MQYAAWLQGLTRGQVAPVVLLHGPEPFLIDEALAALTRVVCSDPGLLAMSREVLEAREAGAEGIVRAAETLPWGTPRRLVVARGVETLGAKQAEPLLEYLRAPNPTTVLAVAVSQALAPSHWLRSAVPAAAVEIPQLAGRALAGWLRSRASADGLELEEDAAQLLIGLVGDDPATLAGEMGKAALAGGPENRRVGAAEVRAVVGEHRSHEVFELTRAVERRDGANALLLLERLLAGGEEPLRILAILSGQSRHATLRTAADRLERCWQVERRLKLGGAPRPELSVLVALLCGA